ncbi:MAG TPA: hypothetical protein VGC77_19295 [Rhodopseudomonas sp.]|uniref:hypothetical protein n=1 Tax=Rhodopseudomonas sp. TaxID=1078 RepID=UPI002ED7B8F1
MTAKLTLAQLPTAKNYRGAAVACALLLLPGAAGVLLPGAAAAQSAPDTENGRFTLAPSSDGVIRLDTRTGTTSICSDKGNGWACLAMPDERAALDTEIGRLQRDAERLKAELETSKSDNQQLRRDNDALQAQLAQREPSGKIDEALPKSDSLKKPEITSKDGERKLEIPLPSDRDLDRLTAFLEHAWRKLVDLANRMQKDVGGDGKI